RSTNGDGGDGGVGGGVAGGIVTPSLGTVDQLINCFANAQWELRWFGVRISLDASCANMFADILTDVTSPTVTGLLRAAFGAGGALLAGLGAAVAAAGGWAIAIITVCAYIFGRWLKSVITAAGAYVDVTWIGPVAWGR